jgi:hypothetical protein
MKLFTSRFVKDLFLIALFSVGFYILLHNPLTHPKLPENKGVWTIQLMQEPLVFGVAGHNYLVLRDDKNEIIKEFHGLATDSNGRWEYIGHDANDTLQVWEFDGSHFYLSQKNFIGIVLYEGDKDAIIATWNRAESCKDAINAKHIPYPPYGVNIHGDTENSNSVAFTLAKCMQLDSNTKHLGLITPGWGKNLLDSR